MMNENKTLTTDEKWICSGIADCFQDKRYIHVKKIGEGRGWNIPNFNKQIPHDDGPVEKWMDDVGEEPSWVILLIQVSLSEGGSA
jgi:hypothetical protein